jgi:hypothetical protein
MAEAQCTSPLPSRRKSHRQQSMREQGKEQIRPILQRYFAYVGVFTALTIGLSLA